jgi:hypothetical protein
MMAVNEDLQARCRGVYDGCGEAIDWVEEVRRDSPRLERESDSLVDKLRRTRNLARRLGRAASRPVSIGFFGLSQAGKSYLISALAAGSNGELETQPQDRRLNFIAHVNPPGQGKEATGLVTRFTRQAVPTPRGFPLELALLTEVDLAKVLGNAFFHDFDREQLSWDLSPSHIRRHLEALERRRQPRAVPGLDADAVVELLEYFEQRFPKTSQELKADFWPTAVDLAPFLEPPDRAALLSLLWGEIPELTDAYLRLRAALARLGHAATLFCPIDALVRSDAEGNLTQADSIMNVDILERLGCDDADLIEVVPHHPGQGVETAAAVALPRSLLAALTAELRFVLAEPPRTALLDQVDLLDFPGYRGRLAVSDLAEVRKQLKNDQVDPVAQLLLRGKVAYLFERYTDDQEMNLLVLCAPSHKQSDVKDLGPVMESWVHSTQGASPEARARRKPGLIWALTMFDMRLNPAPGQNEDLMRKGWEGMMKLALLERFGTYNWLHEWTPGRPFDNLFLVRKPRMAAAVIETDDDCEQRLLPAQAARLEQLRRTFCAEPTVRRHLSDPAAAWDAMLTLNDGGITRLAEYLGDAVSPGSKQARIAEQCDAIADDLVRHRFAGYYRGEGKAEVESKQLLAERVLAALKPRASGFAELLAALQPPPAGLRALYLRADDAGTGQLTSVHAGSPDAGSAANAASGDFGDLIDLDAMLHSAAPGAVASAAGAESEAGPNGVGKLRLTSSSGSRFVSAVFRFWIGHLKAMPDDPARMAHLGIAREMLDDLTGELITAADRLGLEGELTALIDEAEMQAGATRSRLAERQVHVAHARIARFVDYLGCDDRAPDARPRSRLEPRHGVFEPPPPIPAGALPMLSEAPLNYSGLFILDWFEAFRALAVANAGHAVGQEIAPEQNARLGDILARIDSGNGVIP